MAIVKLDGAVKSGIGKRIPRDRYTFRCVAETLEISKTSQQPMLKHEWELVKPEVITTADGKLEIAGAKTTTYTSLTEKNIGRVAEFYEKIGKPQAEINTENPPLLAEGLIVDAVAASEESAARKDPTPEQQAKGQLGDIIKDGLGKEVKRYYLKIEQLLGISSEKVNVPY